MFSCQNTSKDKSPLAKISEGILWSCLKLFKAPRKEVLLVITTRNRESVRLEGIMLMKMMMVIPSAQNHSN